MALGVYTYASKLAQHLTYNRSSPKKDGKKAPKAKVLLPSSFRPSVPPSNMSVFDRAVPVPAVAALLPPSLRPINGPILVIL